MSPPTPRMSSGSLLKSVLTKSASKDNERSNSPTITPADARRPVECTICGRKFKKIRALDGHMQVHGGYKNTTENTPNSSTDSIGRRSGK